MKVSFIARLKLKSKPYNLVGLMALLLLIVSLFSSNGAIDFNLHDTYFVIAGVNICLIIAGFLLIIWVIYIVSYRLLLSIVLTWVHVVATVLAGIMYLKYYLLSVSIDGIPRRYYAFTDFNAVKPIYVLLVVSAVIFITGQFIFLVNLLGGLIKRAFRPKLATPPDS
jgi:heme/copper-type cytochrome/quinol oxidase subunit 1